MSGNIFSPEQKASISAWVAEGASLSEIQKRINSEFGQSITYMELRFLVDDLGVTLKEKAVPAPAKPAADDEVMSVGGASYPAAGGDANFGANTGAADAADAPAGKAPGGVSVTIDPVQQPGVAASGNVTFSDGQSGKWLLDESGQLGFDPPYEGYRPSPADVQQFQVALRNELARGGYLG